MNNAIKVIGISLLIGIVAFGAFYLLGSTGMFKNLNPDLMFGHLVAGFTDALKGIQTSITGMFSNIAK